MSNRKTPVTEIISSLLVTLFTYAALSKWLDLDAFRQQMLAQPLPRLLARMLVWILPPIELMAAALILAARSRLAGLWMSVILMTAFTGYVALILAGFYGSVPCSCGGIISSFGWRSHLVVNLFFLLLTILAIVLQNRERRRSGK